MSNIDTEYIILCEGKNEKLFMEDLFKKQDTFDDKDVKSFVFKVENPSQGIKRLITVYSRRYTTVYFMIDYDDKKVMNEIDAITKSTATTSNFKLIVQKPELEVYVASWFPKATLDATWNDRKLSSNSEQFLNKMNPELEKKWTITDIEIYKGDIKQTKRLEGRFDIAKYIK